MTALILPPQTHEGRAILRRLGRCVLCGQKSATRRCEACQRAERTASVQRWRARHRAAWQASERAYRVAKAYRRVFGVKGEG